MVADDYFSFGELVVYLRIVSNFGDGVTGFEIGFDVRIYI